MQSDTYLIAEIGQNHNGSVEIARALIDMAAMPIEHEGQQLPGIDAVKLQCRDLDFELTAEAARAEYRSPNSFGTTYGEHRAALELTIDEHAELADHARARGLDFIETACQPSAVEALLNAGVDPDRWKVASRDLRNVPLLRAMASTDMPIILSTGMHSLADVQRSIADIREVNADTPLMVLYCVSAYPTSYDDLHLRGILELRNELSDVEVGFSDHTTGILAPAIAAALGATVIEKHITLDRQMRGSDHAGSMGREGLRRFVRDVRNVSRLLGDAQRIRIGTLGAAELLTKLKSGRGLCLRRQLAAGERIEERDLVLLSPPDRFGLSWDERDWFVGKTVAEAVPARTPLTLQMVREVAPAASGATSGYARVWTRATV